MDKVTAAAVQATPVFPETFVPTEQDPAAGGPPADHTAAARPRPDHRGANHAP